jgi:integrase
MKIQLSNIKKLPLPEEGFERYWDDEVKGFGLRIYSSGAVSYVFKYRNVKGQQKQVVIGKNLAPAEARKAAKALSGQVAKRLDPKLEEELERKRSITFRELCQKYLDEELPKLKPRTQIDYGRHLSNAMKVFGRASARSLTVEDFAKYRDKIKAEKGERTANVMLTVIKRVFNLGCGDWALIENNPCASVRKFKEQPRTERLSDKQIKALHEAISKEPDVYVQAFFKLLMRTACRMGELQNMKWVDVNFDTGEWKKPTTKIGEPHIIPLGKVSLGTLKKLLKQNEKKDKNNEKKNPYVFRGRRKGKSLVGLRRIWLRIAERAKIEGIHMHDMRRTIGYILLKNGVSMERVSQILGHKSIRTTERVYAGLDIDEKSKTINTLESLLAG